MGTVASRRSVILSEAKDLHSLPSTTPKPMVKRYCVYIMSNRSRCLYIGCTSNLPQRVVQHRTAYYRGHTSLYRIHRLVYVEECRTAWAMVRRERQLKGWTRARKLALIVAMNPAWDDLAEDWVFPMVQTLRCAQGDDLARAT